jgi:DNA-binding transcriptional ArsR family regulator
VSQKASEQARRHEAAQLLRSLANPNRLAILSALADRSRAVADLESELKIRQPILSQQLAILRDAGLVETRKEQKSVNYFLHEAHAERIKSIIRATLGGEEARLAPGKAGLARRPAPRLDEAAVFARVEPLTNA